MANENRYFKTPFAESGDRLEVPDASVGGAVGFDTGFGPDYELPQGSVNKKRIERDKYNGLHHSITKNLKQWQEHLCPTWIEDAGTGTPFSYPVGMIVNHAGKNWVSNDATNTEEPGAGIKWSVHFDDWMAFTAALYADAGITPNGLPDTAIASQRLDALKAFSKPANSIVTDNGYNLQQLSDSLGFNSASVAASFDGVSSMVGKTVYIIERESRFLVKAGNSPSVLGDYVTIQSTAGAFHYEVIPVNNTVTARAIGADSTGATRTQDAIIDAINLLPLDTFVDLGGYDKEYLLYTSADGTVTFGVNILDFHRRVHLIGRGAKLKLDEGVKAYIAEVNVPDIEFEGICFDGNRANNASHPTSNTLVRSVNVDSGKIAFCQFINGASGGSVLDGCSRWEVKYNYFSNFYRNALQAASSGMVRTDENKINYNYIDGTDDGEFANGIFLSASSATTKKNLTCYRNEIVGNIVKNAGDWGIESGYRMFYTLISGNVVDQAYNICIGARDNTGTVIDGNIAICNIAGSNQINYQIDGASIAGDDVAPNTDAKVILSNNYGASAGTNGINIKYARKTKVIGNILIGRGTGLGAGLNIMSDNADVTDNYVENFQFAYRFNKEDATPLANLRLRNNTANGVDIVFRHEGIQLLNSVIQGNDSTQITTLYSSHASATVSNSRYFANVVADEPFKWSAFLNKFILSPDGLQRAMPAATSTSSIFTPVRACTLRIKLDTGEVALFLVSGEATPTITAIAESTNIGLVGSGKNFRIEMLGSNLVFKRYAPTTTILTWYAEVS